MINPQFLIRNLLLIFICTLSFSAQESIKPSVDKRVAKTPKYRVGQIFNFTNPQKLFLVISVSRSSLSKEKMIALAQRIKFDYPNEQQINAIILDNFKSAKGLTAGEADNPNYIKDHKAVRGYYLLNKTIGVEYVELSTKGGQMETRIDLSIARKITDR